MANNEDENENLSSSTDNDDDDDDDDDEESSSSSSSSSSSTSTDEDDADQAQDESDDDLTSSDRKLTPKQAYILLEDKRKQLSKRLLELRDELKAQPQAEIEVKKRLLIEIKNLREKWIAIQTRLTNMKARLSHSPTPERQIGSTQEKVKVVKTTEPERRIIPSTRDRTSSYSSTNRSRSSSRESDSRRSSVDGGEHYHDLDALDERTNEFENRQISSRVTTSYRDLTEDFSLSASPSPPSSPMSASNSILLSNVDRLSLVEPSKTNDDDDEDENDENRPAPVKQTFTNQKIPYPIVNDKRDLDVVDRLLKNELRQFEASRNNPLFGLPDNLMIYERLKKQNEFINIRLKIERLKKVQPKTQREREQIKKQFHHLLQEFRKLQRFMRSANRDVLNNFSFAPTENDAFVSTIPLPPSPEVPRKIPEDFQLPPLDLHKVTGKKIVFESSDSEDENEQMTSEPHVPVAESISEPRTVPEEFPPTISTLPLPMPSNSSSSATLDAIKTRVANLINPTTVTTQIKPEEGEDEDDEDDEDENLPVAPNLIGQTASISTKFTRKRRRTKKHKNKKKQNQQSTTQTTTNDIDPNAINYEDAWRRHVAMQLQMKFLKQSNPVLKALTAEAQKKLGVSQDEINEFTFDDDMMDYETALILQQQQEFLAAAAANPFHILHNAAAGSSSSRPNLVDVLSTLNGGISPSSSEPQTPMGLLQKFFLDANANADKRSQMGGNDLFGTPPTPPPPRDISMGRKIVESLTIHDVDALLKLSGSEHDDDDDDFDENNENNRHRAFNTGDSDDEFNHLSFDDDDDDDDDEENDDNVPNGTNKSFERWEHRTANAPLRSNSNSNSTTNKKSTVDTLILPSFNRCTHLGKSTKRSAGLERMFPSFSKHNSGPSSTLSLILYGLSSTP